MKDIETLKRLSTNPFYTLTDEEAALLREAEIAEESVQVTRPKAKKTTKRKSSRGNAAVKETGKLEKHTTDPVSE